MSCELTSGRAVPCKTIGGISRLWVYRFRPFDLRQLVGLESGTLSAHPMTLIYEIAVRSASATETTSRMGTDQNVSFTVLQSDAATNVLLEGLKLGPVGVIIEDRNKNKWVFGIESGLHINFTMQTGSAREEVNGYSVTMTGRERFAAPFVADLPGAGFENGEGVQTSCILSSSSLPSSVSYLNSDCNVPVMPQP